MLYLMQIQGDVEKILNTHLGSREREIIKLHFGVDTPDGYPMSLENISHRFVRLSLCSVFSNQRLVCRLAF